MKLLALLCLAALSLGTISAEETSPLVKSLSSGPSVETASSDVSVSGDRSKRHLLAAKLGLLGLGVVGGGLVAAKVGVVGGALLGAKLASGGGGWGGRSGGWGGEYYESGGYYGGSRGYRESYAPSYTSSNVIHHHHEHHHIEQPHYEQQQIVHHQHHHVQEPQYHVQQPQYHVHQPEYHHVEQTHYKPSTSVWSPPADNCVQGW